MQGRYRAASRTQGQTNPRFKQNRFEGGENSDLDSGAIGENQVALLENMIAFPGYLEARAGSQKFSNTSLPGSGTVHSLRQHPTTKKFVLHRGALIWIGDSTMSAWTEAKTYTGGYDAAPVLSGDTGNQISGLTLLNASAANTNAGTLYWTLTNSVTTRTVNLYKNSGKTQLVGTGTINGNGTFNILPQNASGLTGTVGFLVYTGDDTDAGNTITVTIASSFNRDSASLLKPFDGNMVLFSTPSSNLSVSGIILVNLTDNAWYPLNAVSPNKHIVNSGTKSTSTPYGYRYIWTYCRITTTAGAFDPTKNRITGTLVHESGSRSVSSTLDYGEFWLANPIDSINTHVFYLTNVGFIPGSEFLYNPADVRQAHWTHIGLYRTKDIGVNGIDPSTGLGNNREIYTWVDDFPIGSETITISKTDDKLGADFVAGFGLKNRFWASIPDGAVGEVTNSFLFCAARGDIFVRYGQLTHKELAGYYNPAYQFFKMDDGVQILAQSPDILSIICSAKTWTSAYGNTKNVTSPESVFVITHLTISDYNIGVTDYGSFVETKSGIFMAVCSDRTVRQWNRFKWSPDLSYNGVNKIIQLMVDGSVGAYTAGAYYLWYRTGTGPSYNSSCLRFGLGDNAGFGWSRMTGSAWVYPGLYVGTTLIQDANNVQKLLVLDSPGAAFYAIAPFIGYASSLLGFLTDKQATDGSGGTNITPKVRFRTLLGEDKNNTLYHEETHFSVNDWTGVGSGATTATLIAYSDNLSGGDPLNNIVDSLAISFPSDAQIFSKVEGLAIQFELQFASGGFQISEYMVYYQEQKKALIGHGPIDTTEAANQLAVASSMKHWLTRPIASVASLRNRANGSLYTLGVGSAGLVSSPDGNTYGIQLDEIVSQLDTMLYGDFTVMYFRKGTASNTRHFELRGVDDASSFYVAGAGAGVLNINGSSGPTMLSDASTWRHVAIVRSAGVVTVVQNGIALAPTVAVAGSKGGVSLYLDRSHVDVTQPGTISLFDFRVITAALTAAQILYLYNDVVNNTGKKVLPTV